MRTSVAISLAILYGATPLHAQLNGVPIWSPGLPFTTLETAFMVHGGSGDDFTGANSRSDWGFTGAVRWVLASRVTVTGGGGAIRRDVSAGDRAWKPQYFATAALNVFSGSNPAGTFEYGVSLLSGAGLSQLPGDADETNVPVAVDVTGSFGLGGVAVQVYASPRWAWRRTDLGRGGVWQNGFGVSAGATLGPTFGAGLLLAIDWVTLDAAAGVTLLPGTEPFTWLVGFRWAW